VNAEGVVQLPVSMHALELRLGVAFGLLARIRRAACGGRRLSAAPIIISSLAVMFVLSSIAILFRRPPRGRLGPSLVRFAHVAHRLDVLRLVGLDDADRLLRRVFDLGVETHFEWFVSQSEQ